jgi:hypothetical protein
MSKQFLKTEVRSSLPVSNDSTDTISESATGRATRTYTIILFNENKLSFGSC